MKKLNLLILLIGVFFNSCSNDDKNNSIIPTENSKYIKSVTKPDLTQINRDHSFEFNDGKLTKAIGYTIMEGQYEYNNGRLAKKTSSNGQFTYEYDQNGRITKQIDISSTNFGTNNYIEIFYESGKVITHRYYEFGGSPNGNPANGGDSNLEIRQLDLDSEGRIIKMIDLAQDESAIDIEYEQYEYDSRGNIIKVITKYLDNISETVSNITYDDKINPYYIAFKKHYKSTYYIDNFTGITLYNWYGLTPNNIINRGSESRVFEYDEDDYPVSWQRFFSNGTSNSKAFVEYY